MISRKFALALSLTAAFGLIACEDSSTSPSTNNGDDKGKETPADPTNLTPSCEVTVKGNTVTMKFGVESVKEKITTTYELKGDKVIETTEQDLSAQGLDAAVLDQMCEDTKKDYKDAEVTCSGKSVKVVETKDADGMTLADLEENANLMCEMIKGSGPKEIEFGPGEDVGPGEKEDPGEKEYPGETTDPLPIDTAAIADMLKCDKNGDTKEVTLGDLKSVMTCVDGQWIADTSAIASQFECEEEGAKKDMDMGVVMPMVCTDGMWVVDEEAQAERNKCDKEGDKKSDTTSVLGNEIILNYVCEDGEWTVDTEAVEDMFACTAEEEGQKKDMDIYGTVMPMVCKDGEWTPDLNIEEIAAEQ